MEVANKERFNEVLAQGGVTLVDFFADWCGPCKMLSPVLQKLSERYEGKVNFIKVNVDDEMELAVKYNITSIPNMILFKDGEPFNQLIGFNAEPALVKFIESGL